MTGGHPLLPASQHLDIILTGEKKKRNCCWMWSRLCIFSRLREKKLGWFVFWKLANMPGDNNSPDDACLASVRLILPPTHSAPRHLNHFYLLLRPASPPPCHIFHCLAVTRCQCDLYTLFMCVRKHLWEMRSKKNGDWNLISASWMTLPLFLSAGWLKLFEWRLSFGGGGATDTQLGGGGLFRKRIPAGLCTRPLTSGMQQNEDKNDFRITTNVSHHLSHMDNCHFFKTEKGRKLNHGLAYMWMFFHSKAKLSHNNLFLIVSPLWHIKHFFSI